MEKATFIHLVNKAMEIRKFYDKIYYNFNGLIIEDYLPFNTADEMIEAILIEYNCNKNMEDKWIDYFFDFINMNTIATIATIDNKEIYTAEQWYEFFESHMVDNK